MPRIFVLATLLFSLIGCKAINEFYVGEFVADNGMKLDIQNEVIVFQWQGKVQGYGRFFEGFDEVESHLKQTFSGIYMLPAIAIIQGKAVISAFVPRMPEGQESEAGYVYAIDAHDVLLLTNIRVNQKGLVGIADVFEAKADIVQFRLKKEPLQQVQEIEGLFAKDAEVGLADLGSGAIRKMEVKADSKETLKFRRVKPSVVPYLNQASLK